MGHVLRVPPKTRCQLQVQERVVRTGCMRSVTGRAPQTQALPALAPWPLELFRSLGSIAGQWGPFPPEARDPRQRVGVSRLQVLCSLVLIEAGGGRACRTA